MAVLRKYGNDFYVDCYRLDASKVQCIYIITSGVGMITINAKDHSLYQSARIVAAPSEDVVTIALQKDATARRILTENNQIVDGQMVGSRLNLNVLKSTGVFVNTIHSATNSNGGHKHNKGWWGGKVLSYSSIVQMRNVYFNVQQAAREKIASGNANKMPHASVDGEIDTKSNIRFDGVEIRFNPSKQRLFVDGNNNPVRYAEHVTIIGHQVFARGDISYYESVEEAPKKAGNSKCSVVFQNDNLVFESASLF